MKKSILFFALFYCTCFGHGQDLNGKIKSDFITSPSLQNPNGENPTRKLSVYLPPGYDESTNRYPVIYYMHGLTDTDTLGPARKHILDSAIISGKIRPVIFVVSNQRTTFEGSFYSNSSLTGNWSDFTAKDLVEFMDKNYRTIPTKESRGIAGHSMGGYGTIKIPMLSPEIFSSAYALSPAGIGWAKESGPNSEVYKRIAAMKSKEELDKDFSAVSTVSMARAWSPDVSKPPFYCELPYRFIGDSAVADSAVFKKWYQNMPLYMSDDQLLKLKKLKALKLDMGRNDNDRLLIPFDLLSRRLEKLGVVHFAELYIGNHFNKIWADDGRILNDMLPFFNSYLAFDTAQKNKK